MSEPKKVHRIVLTGGPCAGKTTALPYLRQKLTELGCRVFVNTEVATDLLDRGMDIVDAIKHEDWVRFYAYEDALIKRQLFDEELMLNAIIPATPDDGRPVVLLQDRGRADMLAYYQHEDEKVRMMTELGLRPQDMYDYDAVIHMVTAADGAEEFYTSENNPNRYESSEQARTRDQLTQQVWLAGVRYGLKLNIVDNSTDFDEKLRRTLRGVCNVVGLPEPIEDERWFVVTQMPPLDELPVPWTELLIEQAYLPIPGREYERRVRKIHYGTTASHYLSEKRPTGVPGKRIETTRPIDRDEYHAHLQERDRDHAIVRKRRICFLYRNQYFEMDLFQEPHKGKVKLEIELTDHDQEVILPEWLRVIGVTGDARFSNFELSRRKRFPKPKTPPT